MLRQALLTLALPLATVAALPAAFGGAARGESEPGPPDTANEPTSGRPGTGPDALPPIPETPPVTTEHEVKVGSKTLRYAVTAGTLPIANDKGEVEARLFFTSYTLKTDSPQPRRPLMFSFNGGPGSSSVWLHLGGLAPRRVRMLDDGAMPQPPFDLIENEHTWLEATDLVFIDPVDTGYSRAATPELTKRFSGVTDDLASVGAFIRLYLTRYDRWDAPLFLVGESYGTFRAAGLAGLLIEQGIAFNGIVLVSSILDMQTARFVAGNDLPYVLFLPTYTATAWYHGRLPKDLQRRKLDDVLAEVEAWASTEYAVALARGARLDEKARTQLHERLARYTGLDHGYVALSNGRIQIHRFCKELLRDQGKTVGRLDSRYVGFDALGVSERPDFDPSMAAIRPPFTTMLNTYLRRDLDYQTDLEYHILRGLDWDWGSAGEGYPHTTTALADAFARNPYLHLFVASGRYDLATPYFATDYTLDHLPLDTRVRQQIQTASYPVGHMVYLERETLARLGEDVTDFIGRATARQDRPLR